MRVAGAEMGNKQVISRLKDSYFLTVVQEDLKSTEEWLVGPEWGRRSGESRESNSCVS